MSELRKKEAAGKRATNKKTDKKEGKDSEDLMTKKDKAKRKGGSSKKVYILKNI